MFRSQYNTDGSRSDLSADYGPDDTGNTDFLNHYTYDNLQRETSVTQQGGAGSYAWYKKFEFAYNAAGQFDKISAYHFGGQVAFYSDYLYDGMGRITQLTHTTNSTAPSLGSFGSGALAGHRYTYDDASRVASRTSTWRTSEDPADPLALGTVTYAYDHTNQLTGEDRDWALGDTGYTYDDSGNRTNYTDATGEVNYTVGAHNRLTNDDAGWTYAYDNEGNLTSKEDADERYQYDYDHRNRLTKVTYSKDEGSGLVEKWHVDNSYDAFDRLVRRKDNLQQTEWPNLAGSDKVFSYEHGQIVLALEVYGTQTQRFLWGPKTDQLLATEYNGGYYGGGQIYFPLADAQGTITDAAKFWLENAQTQNYVTTVVMHRDIDAYGRELGLQTFAASGVGWQELTYAGPYFIFTGRYTDPLTGLQDNHHRWYNPELGRWMSEDPAGFDAGDANLNRYVHNSPTNFTDPSGLEIAGPGYNPYASPFSNNGPTWSLWRWIYTGDGNASNQVYSAALDAAGDAYSDNYARQILSYGANVDPTGVADATDSVLSGLEEGASPLGIAASAGIGFLPGPNPRKANRILNKTVDVCEEGQAIRKVPNPDGKLGGAAHRAKVAERAKQLKEEGHKIVAGGGLPEKAVGPANARRFPDITTIDPQGRTYYEQIGRATGAGDPVAREMRALDDIQAHTGIRPVFTPYNR